MSETPLGDVVRERSESAWALGALCAALDTGLAAALSEPATVPRLARRAGLSDELAERLLAVLEALGLVSRDGESWVGPELAADLGPRGGSSRRCAQRPAPGRRAAARVASGRLEAGWSLTNSRSSRPRAWLRRAPWNDSPGSSSRTAGLQERLAAPGAAFLDVGAGVGEIGIDLCRRDEHLPVVGRSSRRAARAGLSTIESAGLADRIEMRDQRAVELRATTRPSTWRGWRCLPPAAVADAAIRAVRRALRPGGSLLIATLGSPARGDLGDALAALARALGRRSARSQAVEELLVAAGFADVVTMPRTAAASRRCSRGG